MSHQIKHNVTLGYEIIDDLYRLIQKLKKKSKNGLMMSDYSRSGLRR